MQDRTQPYAWWVSALACVLLASALPVAARLVAGPRGADVHIEFRPSVDGPARERIAARYRLEDPRKIEDTYTWRYDLTDPSPDNIRALINDPEVEDTHEIDRNEYTLEPTAPRTSRRQRFAEGGDTIVGIADGLAIGLVALAGLTLATRTAPGPLLQRGVPELDAAAAGLFRIVFGAVVLVFFVTHRVDASWLSATFDLEIEGRLHTAVIDWLRGRPAVVNLITPWLLTMGVAFTVGIFTRLTYALFVAGALVWAYVAMSISSTHPYSAFVLTLVALLPSRWGDARSLDAWRRRTRGRDSAARPPGRQYGYSVWVPGLVLGVAFAAAAWAKLTVPPGWTDWVLNGTVKYHFITDSVNAPVDWGLQFARHPLLAVLASLFAVATEALLVTTAFTRSDWYRLGLGAAALALLAGFRLFMGVFWPGWWILLLGFLPWQRLGTYAGAVIGRPTEHAATPRRHLVSTAQLIIIAAIVAQQAVVSALKIERAPMFSWYDMYSGTYASPAVWAASRPPVYRIVVSTDRGRAVLPSCNPHGEFIREFETALKGSAEASANVWRALRGCGEDLTGVRDVALEGDVQSFDWDRLAFTTSPSAVTLGPLAADGHAAAADVP